MPRLLAVEGLVLDRLPAGERHLRLALLTAGPGLLTVMLRQSAGASPKPASRARAIARPDVFDHADVVLEAPADGAAPGATYFVREYKIIRRHAGLAKRYEALATAAALARLVARHAGHFETCAPVFDLCRKAWAALEEGAPPEAVHFKALYLLARDEGYPAREQWLPSLKLEDRELALAVLRQPSAKAAGVGDAESRARLRRAFERWLAGHTDFEMEAPSEKNRPA
jgi:hypothetical protein